MPHIRATQLESGIQTLELLDRFYEDVFAGKKRATWRYAEQKIEPGYLIFAASHDPSLLALVWVEDILYVPLRNGYTALGDNTPRTDDEILMSMKSHYPDITLESEVMIVKYSSPAETYARHGIPAHLGNMFGADYMEKLKAYK